MMTDCSETVSKEILDRCAGKDVEIPYQPSAYPSWNPEKNKHHADVEEKLDAWRVKNINDPVKLSRQRKTKPGLMTSYIAPHADFLELEHMSLWLSWTYLFDDIVDFGDFDNKPEELEQLRQQTVEYSRKTLYDDEGTSTSPEQLASLNPLVQALCEIFRQIRPGLKSAALRAYFVDTWIDYVNSAVDLHQKGQTLDILTYMKERLNTSGGYPALAMIMYTSHIQLPDWFFSNPMVAEACRLANLNLSVANDILSFHRELQFGHVDNIVSLLMYHKGLDAQEAINEATRMMTQLYDEFESLAFRLTKLGHKHNIDHEMQVFLRSCRDVVIGLVGWSYEIKRFFNYDPSKGEYAVTVRLDKEAVTGH